MFRTTSAGIRISPKVVAGGSSSRVPNAGSAVRGHFRKQPRRPAVILVGDVTVLPQRREPTAIPGAHGPDRALEGNRVVNDGVDG